MYRVFMHYKRDEWEKFMSTVTPWDLQTLLGLSALTGTGSSAPCAALQD